MGHKEDTALRDRGLERRPGRSGFVSYAWGVLLYNLFVVAWGAFVRATGSGAGCGSHWPLCNGEVLPRSPQAATIIEFTHRATSGLALIAVAVLVIWAYRAFEKGHPARIGATLSAVFIVTEALIGAGLVIFEHVAQNRSMSRAFSLSAHLINTLILLAVMALTAWWGSGRPGLRLHGQGRTLGLILAGAGGLLVLGVSGAITALGDTLFPAQSLASGVAQDFSPAAHLFVRLRVLHPAIAAVACAYLVVVAMSRHFELRALSRAILVLVVLQLAAGAANMLLLAPVPLQLVHLLLADLLWLAFVLFGAAALGGNVRELT